MLLLPLAATTLLAAATGSAPIWHGELPARDCAVDKDPLRIRVLRSEECRGGARNCCVRSEKFSLWHPRSNMPVWIFEQSAEGGTTGPFPAQVNIECHPGRVDVAEGQNKPVSLVYRGPTQPMELHESVMARVSALQTGKGSGPQALAEAQSLVRGLRLISSLNVAASASSDAARLPKAGTGALAEATLVLARELAAAGEFDAALQTLADLEDVEAIVPESASPGPRAKKLAAEISAQKRTAFPLRITDRRKVGPVPLEVGAPPELEPDLFFHEGALCLTPATPTGETKCFDPAKKGWAARHVETPVVAGIDKVDCAYSGCVAGTCFRLPASPETPKQKREFPVEQVMALYKGGALLLRDGKLHQVSDVGVREVGAQDASSFLKDTPGSRLFGGAEFYIDDAGHIGRVAKPGTTWELPAEEAKAARSPLNAQFPVWKTLFASPDQTWVVAVRRELEGAKARLTDQELWLFKLERAKPAK